MNKIVALLTTVLLSCSGAFALSVPPKAVGATAVGATKKSLARSHKLAAKHKAKHHKVSTKNKTTKPLAAKSHKLTKSKTGKGSSLSAARHKSKANSGHRATAKVSHTSAKPVSVAAKSSRNL